MVPSRPKINNYAYETVSQPGPNGRRGYQPRWPFDDGLPYFKRAEANECCACDWHGADGSLQVAE